MKNVFGEEISSRPNQNIMKKCRYCMTEIDSKAKICPNCKKSQSSNANKLIKSLIKIFLVVIMILVLLYACSSLASIGSKVLDKEIDAIEQSKYSIIEEPTIIIEGSEYLKAKYIVGTVKNNTNSKTNYVQIIFNLYDKENNVIGSAFDNINHIEPNGSWKFKAIILEENFDSFKFESITGF
ncbi:MAG: FxLYD domain-containing protein [Bacilli bacterium]|nr:FxLYD domain-containing protein [Bacilli bacterium]